MPATIPFLPLPAKNGFSVHKRPTFATIVHSPQSGVEVRMAQQRFPLWEFELTYETLRDETQNSPIFSPLAGFHDFRNLSALFLCVNGQAGRFYYEDPTDSSRLGQKLGTGNGVTKNYFFVRTIGGAPARGTEVVGAVNIGHAINVYLNGTPVLPSGNWALGIDAVSLEFVAAPGAGVVITADFWFFYKCRFTSDDNDFEQFFKNRWLVKTLKFRSVLEPDPDLAVGYGPVPPP